jgi:hypothetical protein
MTHSTAAAMSVVGAMALGIACSGPKDGEMAGSVFVVTRGGENVKLGLVSVSVFPEDVLRAHVEKKRAQAETDLAGVREAIKAAETPRLAASNEVQRLDAIWSRELNASISTGSMTKADAALTALEKAKKAAQTEDAKVWALKDRGRALTSCAYYMDGLSSPSSTTKTDADGKFALRLPRNTKVGLAAQASRMVGNSKEEYCWLVWSSLDGKDTAQVMLSNDNLWGVQSSQAVVTPDVHEFAK